MIKHCLQAGLILAILLPIKIHAVVIGDANSNGNTGLDDAILVLHLLAGSPDAIGPHDITGVDAGIDRRIGMEEVLFVLDVVSGNRNNYTAVYDIGPGKEYPTPDDMPWESLSAGSLVRIFHRPEPYRNKWVLAVTGTSEDPVIVRGIPGDSGELPIISGENATTRLALDYWNEVRSVVKIGGSSYPDSSARYPAHITLENLDIRAARPPYVFTDEGGSPQTYSTNAAAVHVEEGTHITIRNCTLQDSGNGLFAGHLVSHLMLDGNYIHSNGISGSIYQHNSYTECDNITFQFNHYGPLREGCRGNNLKDRSVNTVVRYNWIDTGNRTLDLVDSDYAEFYTRPEYRETWVYGNILIKGDAVENGQIVHYGGDSGSLDRYRKGTLWFYNNTVISYRTANTTLFGLSTNDEAVSCFNNVFWQATAPGNLFAIMGDYGQVTLEHSLLPENWRTCHCTITGSLLNKNNLATNTPGFINPAEQDFRLLAGSPASNLASPLPAAAASRHPLQREYIKHQLKRLRLDTVPLTSGAYGTN